MKLKTLAENTAKKQVGKLAEKVGAAGVKKTIATAKKVKDEGISDVVKKGIVKGAKKAVGAAIFAGLVRAARFQKEMTQQEAADAVGVSRREYNRWERGAVSPKKATATGALSLLAVGRQGSKRA